jgi:iron complex outermembrane receptor protein
VASISAGTGGLHSRLGVGDVEIAVSSNQGFVEINSFADRDYRSVVATELGDDRTTSLRLTFDQELGRRAVLRGSYTDANVRYLETIGTTAPTRYAQRLTSAAAEIDLTPTRFLTLTAGLANDAAETTDAGGREPLGRKDGLGWRLGATWLLPMQGLRLHASASERRRFPALRELYSGALGRFAPNPELRPETAHSTEVGVTFLRGAFDAQAVAFSQRIDDAVVRVTLPDRRFQRLNRDRFTSSGLELTTGAILGGTTLRADLTAQRARIADVSVTNPAFLAPEDVPSVFGSLLATRSLTQGVDVMGRVRVLGDTKCTNPNTSTLDTQRGTQTVDLGLERRWTRNSWMRRVRASVQVENVLDRALYDKCGLPQAGRTARVGFTLG